VIQSWFKEHQEDLQITCKEKNLNIESVKACVAGLYDKSCKGWHGHDHYAVICAKYWDPSEMVALALMFEHYGIEFRYMPPFPPISRLRAVFRRIIECSVADLDKTCSLHIDISK